MAAKIPSQLMEPPEDFGFPFAPYPIQENFMRELFNVLSSKQLGIFESRKLKILLG